MIIEGEKLEVLKKVLNSRVVQLLIGAEEWDLTEEEEVVLIKLIELVE